MDTCPPPASVCTAKYWKSDIPGKKSGQMAILLPGIVAQELAAATPTPHPFKEVLSGHAATIFQCMCKSAGCNPSHFNIK
jgi:hypothetical protein